MINLGFVFSFFARILSGERFRKATSEEKKVYTVILNIVALVTLCSPLLSVVLNTGSNLKLWLAVMAVLIPSVMISFWLYERLTMHLIVAMSSFILLAAILLAILDMFSIYSGFTSVNALIGLGVYFSICGFGLARNRNH